MQKIQAFRKLFRVLENWMPSIRQLRYQFIALNSTERENFKLENLKNLKKLAFRRFRRVQVSFQNTFGLLQGLGPVRDTVLHGRRNFAECFAKRRIEKKRVVAKTIRAFKVMRNHAMHFPISQTNHSPAPLTLVWTPTWVGTPGPSTDALMTWPFSTALSLLLKSRRFTSPGWDR